MNPNLWAQLQMMGQHHPQMGNGQANGGMSVYGRQFPSQMGQPGQMPPQGMGQGMPPMGGQRPMMPQGMANAPGLAQLPTQAQAPMRNPFLRG